MIERIAVLDFETTGLLQPSAAPLNQQPHITEVGLIIVRRSKGLREIESLTSLVNPEIPIPREVIKINGITDKIVADAPTFPAIFPKIVDLMFGCRTLIAHNLSFDRGVLVNELRRIGRRDQFPWPPEHICTVEETSHICRKNNHAALYKIATGADAEQTHRALDDVQQLVTILRWIQEKENPLWLGGKA